MMWQVPPHNPPHRGRLTQVLGILIAVFCLFFTSPRVFADPTLANITGTVFRDFNDNGTQDTREPGIANVSVTGTDQTGATATATTAGNGTYTLSGLTGMARVEFTLPADNSLNFLQPAAAGGSLVQFVDATSATTANAGFFNPGDYAGPSPRLATTIFRRGNNTGVTDSAIDDYPYTANNTFGNIGAHQVMNANTGGTLYGLAYQRTTDRLYSGSYIRRGASLGSTESTGAIYRTTTPTGTPGTALLVNLNGLNSINTGTNPHPKATTGNWVGDGNAYAATGKVGLGDLEISDDDLTLYATNLNQRSVVVIPFNSDKITVNTAAVTQVTVPTPANCGSTIGQVRPFGLKFNDGFLYVGTVCTAETSNTITDLRAYVFQFNPTTNTFVTTPVLEFALTYPRRHINDNFGNTAGNTADGEWRPWSDSWRPTGCYGCSGDLWGWPQPVLTDIEFDGEGFMMLGFRDRLADQAYYEQDPGPNNGTQRQTRNGGDLLLACLVSGTWTLENAGACNGRTTADPNSDTGEANLGSGPGNREFYYQDNYSLDFTPDYHRDTELGSLALIKGNGEIVTTLYDTYGTFEAGTITLNNDTGARVRGAQLYPEGATFGKAGGIGDVELLAAPAPIEIGNRLWRDTDGDGIQDPNESGLAGVTVQLYSGTTLVGTAVTNLNGNYLFSSDTSRTDVLGADYGITQMTAAAALQIRVVPTVGQNANALGGLALTTADADSTTNGDVRDSDASLSGGNAIIAVTLGAVGQNNHTYDIGYTPLGTIGNRVWLDEDSNGYQDEGEAGIANVTVQLKNNAGTVIATTVTDSNGNYIFKNLPAATYYVQVLGSTVATGLSQTTIYPNAGADETNQNQSTGNGYQIVLGVAQNNLTADFGYNWNPTADVNGNTNTAAIGDCVWIDVDGDGAQDPNEAGIANVTVSLITAGPDNLFGTSDDVTTATTTTGATGCYLFDGLTPGAYIVRVTPPSGYTQTGDPDHWGTTGANDNQTTVPVILGPGDVFLDADFGYQPNAGTFGSIGNTVWFDFDSDGCGPNPSNGDGSSGNCTTPDAGELLIANVTVVLIRDTNGNGTWDAGEPIIATDITDANGQYLFPGLPIADGTGTDDYIVWVNDTYNALKGLTPTYDQNGIATPNISAATNLNATPVTNQDFGYNTDNSGQSGVATTLQTLPTGTDLAGGVGDRVWLDIDNDGVQDAGEPGISGVQVNLLCLGLDGTLNTSDDIRQSVFTSVTGTYFFTDIPVNTAGNSCTVTVVTSTLPGTLTQTYDANGTGTPHNSTIALTTANPVNTAQDFGYRGTGTIGNLVWRDTNANGVFDTFNGPDGTANTDDDEIALAGVTVTLWYDRNANGKIDVGDTPINTLTTDASGAYLFTGLSTTNTAYLVDVTDTAGVLTGYWHSLGAAATNNNSQIDPHAVTLTAASPNYLNADFGYYVKGAALGNRVWFDANANGLQDTGERGISGAIVTLTIVYPGSGTTSTLATVTNALGYYSFGNLLLDEQFNGTGTTPTHTISVNGNQVALSGFGITTIDVGSNANDLRDSDNPAGVVGTATQGLVTIPSTTTDPLTEPVRASYDFGYVLLGTIGNRVWLDEDSNGYQDEGEAGIPNVTVQLKNSGGTVIATTITDSNGNYIFKNLPAGSYFVQVLGSTITTGLTQTTIYPNAGADETNQNQSTGNGYAVTLAAGGENLTADFGYNWNPTNDVNNNANTAAIGDCVWIDADGDGIQDPEEAGIPGVTVQLITAGADGLFGTADDVVAGTTTTSATGCYIFRGLTPGAYVVRIPTPPTGYTQTGDPDHFGSATGTNDNQTTIPVVLGPGDVFLDADFGYQPNAGTFGSIGDTVWLDIDADGVGPANTPGGGDTNEPYIPNVTVVLIRDSNANGVWDAGEPIIATDITDANGYYLFPGLPITDGTGTDDYLVYVNDTYNALKGLTQTYDQNGIATPNISSVLNLATTPVLTQDFGYVYDNTGQSGAANTTVPLPGLAEQPGRLGDRVWLDINANSTQDAGEPGIRGVQVNLSCADGTTMSTVTGINGFYLFDNIPVSAGGNSCVVTVVSSTLPGNVTQTYDADGTGTAHTSTISLTTANPVNLNQDFGYRGLGTIGNLIWLDTDANGVFTSVNGPDGITGTDDDEPLLSGVTVTLWFDRNSNGKIDTGDYPLGTQATTGTLVNGGNYLFSGLPTNNTQYIVDVTDTAGLLGGYWHSLGAAGTNNNSQIDPYGVTLTTAAPNYLNADFGYYVKGAALGNRVWNDDNSNGLQDTNEPGISGVVVTLLITYPGGATTTLNTLTNSVGYYSFGNLLLDEDYNGTGTTPTHTISVNTTQANLNGYTVTTVDVGSNGNDLRDSDNHAGVAAITTQGLTTIPTTATDPLTEPTRASYDFGFVSGLDYGDLPTTYSNIQLANNGARHVVGALRLGTLVDTDGDGAPSILANGDDVNDGTDDEDGAVKTPGSIWQAGGSGYLDITVSGGTGFVSAWIDWNRDGDFADAGERIFVDQSISNATQTVTFPIPAGTTFPSGQVNNLRVRVYSATTGGTASPVGLAAGIGEVEDHQLNSAPLGVTLESFGAQCRTTDILASWVTLNESDILGFNVWRGATDAAPDTQLNGELIASQAPGGGQGASYDFADTSVTDGNTYYYWLESVSINGDRERFGPVNAAFPCEVTAVTMGGFDAIPATPLPWGGFAIGALLLAGVVLARRK